MCVRACVSVRMIKRNIGRERMMKRESEREDVDREREGGSMAEGHPMGYGVLSVECILDRKSLSSCAL